MPAFMLSLFDRAPRTPASLEAWEWVLREVDLKVGADVASGHYTYPQLRDAVETGRDDPRRPRLVQTDADRHMSNDWFRHNVWNPALAAADLGFRVTPHGLRHAHASWLLAGGADLQVVKERLGHGSITTTERYLHGLPDAGQAALAALDKMRPSPDRASGGPLSDGAQVDLSEALRAVDGQTARLLLAGLLAKARHS
jgi:integrase